MFSFFQTIFAKITSAIASVIIAVGLVSTPIQLPEPQNQTRIIEENKAAQNIETERASSTTTKFVPASVPTSTKTKVTASLTKPKSVSSNSLTSTTSQSSNVVVESSNTSSIQTTITPPTITTQPSTETTQQASATATTEELQIASSKITPYRTSAQIEWQTNRPTQSRAFIWSGSFNKVYQSESGLSTRHFVNASGLSAGTNYSYELESIAGEQVARKQDSFSTLPEVDNSEILVMVKQSTPSAGLTNLPGYSITVSILGKDGKSIPQAPFHWIWPQDDSDYIFFSKSGNWENQRYAWENRVLNGIDSNGYWTASLSYLPTTTGTKNLYFTATTTSGVLTKTVTIDVK